MLAGGALLLDQILNMGGALDLCPLVVAALMAGKDPLAIEESDFSWIGEHGQGALHMGVWIE